MGAWGFESFENDGAGGLVADLRHSEGLESIHKTFDMVLENDDYIEVYEAQAAVAAGEVVALLRDAPGRVLPKALVEWRQKQNTLSVDSALIERAIDAVQKVYENSEMRELWEDTDDFEFWQNSVVDLLTRLQNLAQS